MGLAWASRVGGKHFRGMLARSGIAKRSNPTCLTAVAKMSGAAASIEPERWEEVLDHLSSMISGKRRADGATWRDAHENMPVYLQVLAAVKLPHAGQCCAAATVSP
jgi:hypothetical protein